MDCAPAPQFIANIDGEVVTNSARMAAEFHDATGDRARLVPNPEG